MRDIIRFLSFLVLMTSGCIEPATQADQSTQNSQNTTNNEPAVRWDVHSSKGLVGLFEFSSGSPPYQGLGGELFLEGDVSDDELRGQGRVGFVTNALQPIIEEHRGLSLEMWWGYQFVDGGRVISLDNDVTPVLTLEREQESSAVVLTTPFDRYEVPDVLLPEVLQHIALTVDDRFLRLYVDGVLCFSALSSPEVIDALSQTTDVRLADEGTYYRYRSVALYGRSLLAAEVAHHALLGEANTAVGVGPEDLISVAYRSSETVDQNKAGYESRTFSPSDARDGLMINASTENVHAVIRFPIDGQAFEGIDVRQASVRLGTIHFRPKDSWYFKVYALARAWDPMSVSWLKATATEAWLEDGGIADVTTELASLSGESANGNSQTELLRIDVSAQWSRWLDDNPGLLLSTRNVSASFEDGPHQGPTLLVVGTGDVPAPTGEATSSRAASKCRVSQSSPPATQMEVYIDRELAAVTSGPFVDVEPCPSNLIVVWRDLSGQLSDSQVLSF